MNIGVRGRMVALLSALAAVSYGTVWSSKFGGDPPDSFQKSRMKASVFATSKNEPMVTLKIPEGKSALDFGYVTSISSPAAATAEESEEAMSSAWDCVRYFPDRRGLFRRLVFPFEKVRFLGRHRCCAGGW